MTSRVFTAPCWPPVTSDRGLLKFEYRVSSLKSRVSSVKSRVSSLKSRVSSLKSRVSSLKSRVSSVKFEYRVSSLKSRVSSCIHASESLALPLAQLYQSLFNSGVDSKEWKVAMVTPIFKKGNSTDASNYRPISLTSLCCKIMESVMKDDILAHLLSKG